MPSLSEVVHKESERQLVHSGKKILALLQNATLEPQRRYSCFGEDSEDETNSNSAKRQKMSESWPPIYLSYKDAKQISFNFSTIAPTVSFFDSLHKMLSEEKPMADLINSGLLTNLVRALSIDNEKMQREAAEALDYLARVSKQTNYIVEAGAIPPLVRLLYSENPYISRQADVALGKITEKSSQLENDVIKSIGVEVMARLVDPIDEMKTELVRMIARYLHNVCLRKNADLELMRKIGGCLGKLIQYEDNYVRNCAWWALLYLKDGPNEQKEIALNSGRMESVMPFMRLYNDLVPPALRTLADILAGNDELAQKILDVGLLKEMPESSKRSSCVGVMTRTCWLISNTSGTQDQIQQVIDAGLLGHIVDVLSSGEYKCQVEAARVLLYVAQRGTSEQIYALVQEKALPAMITRLGQKIRVNLHNSLLEAICGCLKAVSENYSEHMDSVRAPIDVTAVLGYLDYRVYSYPETIDFRYSEMVKTIRTLLER